MTKTKRIDGPIKWHGGKSYLAPQIVALMPPRCANPNNPATNDSGWLHYVEPYFGGGAVLLANDPEGISEVVNDRHSLLTNFWSVLRCSVLFPAFLRRAEATPFAEEVFAACLKCVQTMMQAGEDEVRQQIELAKEDDRVKAAWAFFVACRQSLSGRMDSFAGITRNRTRRAMNEQVSAWLNAIESLLAVHARLQRVLIRNQPAIDVIAKEDGPRTLFYLDPPYLHETRATTGEYQHEMTTEQHAELLAVLGSIKGRFLLSGYHSTMYDAVAQSQGWTCHQFSLPNNSAGGKSKRRMIECIWQNW